MSHTPLSETCDRLAESCTALVLVAISADGQTQVQVQEPGLALSLAVANTRLRKSILPQDILRMQAILGELGKAHTERPAPKRSKAGRSKPTPEPSPASPAAEEATPGS